MNVATHSRLKLRGFVLELVVVGSLSLALAGVALMFTFWPFRYREVHPLPPGDDVVPESEPGRLGSLGVDRDADTVQIQQSEQILCLGIALIGGARLTNESAYAWANTRTRS